MKYLFFIPILFFITSNIFGQSKTEEKDGDRAFYETTKTWFSAWKLVSKDIYEIDKVRPVDFVFFDDKYVYSTSTTTIKNGKSVRGCNLLNLSLFWKKNFTMIP